MSTFLKGIMSIAMATFLVSTLTGCAPRSFVRSAPGWKTIELRSGLTTDYDQAWRTTVDTVARNWDIEILDKDSGYLRTAWLHGISGASYERYRGRLTIKYPDSKNPTKLEVKTDAQWLEKRPLRSRVQIS